MPIMDGFEACNVIKTKYQDLPVVALSGESGLDIKALVRVNGFDDFVPKPAKREQIEFVVEKYTAARIESKSEP
jgi:two-component system autoinducer 1 sensor kinase/phosphatase LuxN